MKNKIILTISIIGIIGIVFMRIDTTAIENKEKTQKTITITEEKQVIKKNENIVFLGDSITDFYPIDEIYGDNLPIVKSGVVGYTTKDILNRMDSMVYQYNPTSVFLLIGTNNLTYNEENDIEETTQDIKTIIQKINENRKNAKIYLQSLYPINESLDKTKDMVGYRNNESIKKVNEIIKSYCNNNSKCVFINTYDELTDEDGNFSKDYTNDGLHPNTLGYAKITRILMKYIYHIDE